MKIILLILLTGFSIICLNAQQAVSAKRLPEFDKSAYANSDRHIVNVDSIKINAAKTDFKKYSRKIYMKLPLLQPRFHWRFIDSEAFLKGELTLKIESGGEVLELPIFKEGVVSKEWNINIRKGHNEDGADRDELYFLFTSKGPYDVSETDKVSLALSIGSDIYGIGSDSKGFLRAGNYKSEGNFKLFHLEGSDNAYLNVHDWNVSWELDITSNKGWMEAKYDKKDRDKLTHDKSEYIIGFKIDADGSRSVSVIDHVAEQYYFENFRNHSDFLAYIKENQKNLPLVIPCSGSGAVFVKTCEDVGELLAPIELTYSDGKKSFGPKFNIHSSIEYFSKYKNKCD